MVKEIDRLMQVKVLNEEDNSNDEFNFVPYPSGKVMKYKKKIPFGCGLILIAIITSQMRTSRTIACLKGDMD